jgi:hypothetical protein
VAFSAGGAGVGKSPEHQAQSAHVVCGVSASARPQTRHAARAAGVALAGELVEMQQHDDIVWQQRRLDA